MLQSIKNAVAKRSTVAAPVAVGVVGSTTSAFAVDTTVAELFAAYSFAPIMTGLGTLLLAGAAIRMLMLGYSWVKRSARAA